MAERVERSIRMLCVMMLAILLTGCGGHVAYVKGRPLRTEPPRVTSIPEYQLVVDDTQAGTWQVSLQRRDRIVRETQTIYEKVEVRDQTEWFQPDFLLWPVNLVRTPLGIAGATVSTVSMVVHFVGAEIGGGLAGMGVMILASPLSLPVAIFGGWDAAGAFLGGTFRIFAGVVAAPVETLLGATIDLPQTFIWGTPVLPITRVILAGGALNEDELSKGFFDPWQEAIRSYWKFASGYEAYPPFLIWPEKVQRRRVVSGEEMPGEWVPQEPQYTDWQMVPIQRLFLQGEGWGHTVQAQSGTVTIDFRQVVKEEDLPWGLLEFTLVAPLPDGTAKEKQGTVIVRPSGPVVVASVSPPPGPDGSISEPNPQLQLSVTGDYGLVKVTVIANGFPFAVYPTGDEVLGQTLRKNLKVPSLTRGKNTVRIIAVDGNGRQTEKALDLVYSP